MELGKLKALKKKYKYLDDLMASSEPETLRQYTADYGSYFSDYQAISNFEELIENCLKADITYIGDYHSLSLVQERALELLNKFVDHGKQFTLCLEMAIAKHQPFVDAFMKQEISEKEFLAKTDYRHNWPFEWKNFKPFFDFARVNKIDVKGIGPTQWDQGPEKSERFMAAKIASYADKQLVVIVGEAHLCPSRMPAKVNKLLSGKGKRRKHATILQGHEAIYWKLAKRNLEDEVEVTKLRKNVFNITNSSPLIRIREDIFLQNEYLISRELDGRHNFYSRLCHTMDKMIKTLVGELQLPRIKKADYPRLFTSLNYLKAAGIGKEEIKTFETEPNGSYKLENNIIYLVEFTEEEMAEECAHFVNFYFNKGAQWLTKQTCPVNVFYAHCIAEAMAHFGTKIIDSDCVFDETIYKKTKAYSLFRKHIKCEKNYSKASSVGEVYPFEIFQKPKEIVNLVFHLLGYRLGEMLHKAFQEGEFSNEEARKLMAKSFRDSAFETYLSLVERLA